MTIRDLTPYLSLLVIVSLLACVGNAFAQERTIGADPCSLCGSTQYPHNVPYRNSNGNAATPLPPPPPPNPMPKLIDEAVRVRLNLLRTSGIDLPEIGEPADLEHLDAVLGEMVSRANVTIDNLQQDIKKLLDRQVADVNEITRLHNLANDLQQKLGRLTQQIERNAKDLGAREQEKAQLKEKLRQIEIVTANIRAETHRTLNRVFNRLDEAEKRGWILPPSAYRELPSPLPVTTFATAGRDSVSTPLTARAGDLAKAIQPKSNGSNLREHASFTGSAGGEASIREKLQKLDSLQDQLRKAVANRNSQYRAVEKWRAERGKEAAKVSLLQSQRVELEEKIAIGKRRLANVQERVASLAKRLTGEQAKGMYDLVEWGIGNVLDKRTEKLMQEAYSNGMDTALLFKFRDAVTAAAQLGSDTLGVVERVPKAMTENGESMEELQRDLAEAKQKFGLSLISTYTDIPGPLLPYLMKEK